MTFFWLTSIFHHVPFLAFLKKKHLALEPDDEMVMFSKPFQRSEFAIAAVIMSKYAFE